MKRQKVTLWVEVADDDPPLSSEYAIVVAREMDAYVTDWDVEDAE
jgi:hypothetical protein